MDLRETPASTVNRHPWELARVTALRTIAETYQLLPPGARVLDLGCGDGFIIDALCSQAMGPIAAVDIHLSVDQLTTLSTARPRLSFHNSYHALAGKEYDVITMFDVLEHVEEDTAFLQETMARFAAPGARLFCTVPAFHSLFCAHDAFLNHHRRYNRHGFQQVLAAAGLRVMASGYLFGMLLPARALTVVAERLLGAADTAPGIGHWRHGHLLTSAIKALLDADNSTLLWLTRRGITIPGLTVWALCAAPR